MKHRGEIVEQAVRSSGIPISKIAKRMNKSRSWMYLVFANRHVSIEIIHEIGKIIHYNFNSDLSIEYPNKNAQSKSDDHPVEYTTSSEDQNWKERYYALMEKYTELLERLKQN